MKLIYIWLLLFLLFSCYGVNEKTSSIAPLNTECLSKVAWFKIKSRYSVKNIKDSKFIDALEDINNESFSTDVLYFKNKPEELIAIATDHYSVRYVFNLNIDDNILNGFQLSEKEKKRIQKRIQFLLMEYQCEDGKKKSLLMLQK